MKAIDVEGLPEPIAQALQSVVETLRAQLREINGERREPVVLRTRPGTVLGRLTRKEIYEDAV